MIATIRSLGSHNPNSATRNLTLSSLATAIVGLMRNSTMSHWLIVGLTPAVADAAIAETSSLDNAEAGVVPLATAERIGLFASVSAPSPTFAQHVNMVAGSGLIAERSYRSQGGRIYSASLLSTASSGLPNQRQSWGDAGQLIEDIVDGLLLQITDVNSHFEDVVNPSAVRIDQAAKSIGFYKGAMTDPGAALSLLTYGIFTPQRSAGGDFLE